MEADNTWRMVHQASMNALRRLSCSARLGTADEFSAAMALVTSADAAGDTKRFCSTLEGSLPVLWCYFPIS